MKWLPLWNQYYTLSAWAIWFKNSYFILRFDFEAVCVQHSSRQVNVLLAVSVKLRLRDFIRHLLKDVISILVSESSKDWYDVFLYIVPWLRSPPLL